MKLYAYRFCPFCRNVRIALAEKGIAYEYVETDPKAKHPPQLIGRTPMESGVPVLRVLEDFVLYDSAAIILWLDSAYPGSVTPSARDPQATARSLAGWARTKLYSTLHSLLEGDDKQKNVAETKMLRALRNLDRVLPQDSFIVGSSFCIADMALAPALVVLPERIVKQTSANMQRYIARLRDVPSVKLVCELHEGGASRPSQAA